MERKMMGISSMWVLGLVVLALITSPVNAITCQEAEAKLAPCLSFLVGNGGSTVPGPCCLAAQSLNNIVSTKADRQAICECFKEAGLQIGVEIDKAKQLVQTCHIEIGFPVDPNVDCTKS